MADQFDRDTVKQCATLAHVRLTDAEIDVLAPQLSSVMNYVQSLSEVSTEGVAPMSHVADFPTPQREDVVTPSLPKFEALKNAPNQDGDFFVVPKVK